MKSKEFKDLEKFKKKMINKYEKNGATTTFDKLSEDEYEKYWKLLDAEENAREKSLHKNITKNADKYTMAFVEDEGLVLTEQGERAVEAYFKNYK